MLTTSGILVAVGIVLAWWALGKLGAWLDARHDARERRALAERRPR